MRTLLNIAGKTDVGKRRKNNEDTFHIDPDLGLMILADGMGGHNTGDVASQLATKLVSEQMKLSMNGGEVPIERHVPFKEHFDRRTLLLGDCIKLSNQAVYEAGQSNEENRNMGTTMVAAVWLDGKLGVAHVGDSRLYVVRDGDITQCTNDHSFIQEQIDRGFIKPEDAEKSDMRNMLTRSIGVKEDVDVDLKEIDLSPHDFILLCSDGLTRMLDDDQIAATILEQKVPDKIAEELIKRANNAGGLDNITVIIAQVEGGNSLTDKVKDFFQKGRSETGDS